MNEPFKSKEELAEFIDLNIPILIEPTEKSKYAYIPPFVSNNAMEKVVKGLTDRLWDRLT
jgi:hypothetical protein